MPVMRQYVNTLAMTCRLAGEWISNKGCWRIPLTHYNALLSGLKSIPNVQLTVDPLPPAADLIVKVKTHIAVAASLHQLVANQQMSAQ